MLQMIMKVGVLWMEMYLHLVRFFNYNNMILSCILSFCDGITLCTYWFYWEVLESGIAGIFIPVLLIKFDNVLVVLV